MNIAIIPARGGSKRIPKKNIREFLGIPIIHYPIWVAKQVFDRVVVSTEDYDIATVAWQIGVEVHRRPKELADDETPAGEVIAECAKHYPSYKTIACIYPTSVFVTPKMLNKALRRLPLFEGVMSIQRYPHPPQRALVKSMGRLEMYEPFSYQIRTQDFQETYFDAAQFYVMKRKPLMTQKSLLLKKMSGIEVEAQDIDTPDDWEKAERLYKCILSQT